ncbi:hypothetical protein BGX31_004025 [Mortierella sp. GBA43]|nr:hypothetical protein BGX31_004025 [Mortierella sp. GBA43]
MTTPLSTLTKDQIKDRILGCLFGNAVGDAYGLASEFMSKSSARQRYGNGPIAFGKDEGYPVWIDGHRSRWERNDFTDDTDQMLLLLQSLQQTQDGRLHAANFSKRLREWSVIGFPELGTPPRGIGFTVGSTLSHPEFRFNPHKAAFDIWDKKGRTLAANGAIMRTSVLGVESFWDEARVVENALSAAKVTHADPRSVVSALIASVLISRLLRGGGRDSSEDTKREWNPKLGQEEYRQELLDYLERGTDIKGDQSYDPVYEPETTKSAFTNKDEKAIAKNRSATGSTTASQGSARTFRSGVVGRVVSFVTGDNTVRRSTTDPNKNRPRVELRDDIGWAGIDNVGEDQAMGSLAHSIVNDYKFLLLETDVLPATITINKVQTSDSAADTPSNKTDGHDSDPQPEQEPASKRIQRKWAQEMESSCFPAALEDLDLDHDATMGYTFKCLGIGVYAATRDDDSTPTNDLYKGPSGLFRGVIEQVTLEAGDADTNCAVVGSLLGTRFGLEGGIPRSWWSDLRHYQWLKDTINEFADRVIAMYEEQEQQLSG